LAAVVLGCLAGATALSSQAPAQSQPAFRADTRLVEVNVVVRDRSGRPIEGLTRSDFTLFEDGQAQTIDIFVQLRRGPQGRCIDRVTTRAQR